MILEVVYHPALTAESSQRFDPHIMFRNGCKLKKLGKGLPTASSSYSWKKECNVFMFMFILKLKYQVIIMVCLIANRPI